MTPMERLEKRIQRTTGQPAALYWMLLLALLTTVGFGASLAQAVTADWSTTDLDTWSYVRGVSPGSRAHGPTFSGIYTIAPSGTEFEPLPADDPARLGMTLLAFDTSAQITSGLPTAEYQLTSVELTLTLNASETSGTFYYEDQSMSWLDIFDEVEAGNLTTQRPIELYGVGFREGYTGYEFSGASAGPPLLDDITHPYTASDGGYIAYPIDYVGGEYVDLSNSPTGGFSATAPGNTTASFDPTPWAIGAVAGLTSGDVIPYDTLGDITFTFDVDLDQPGVRDYVQQSLSDGALGMFVSSLHSTANFGTGGGYPQWLLAESTGFPYNSTTPPTLSIDYEIVQVFVPGDYDGNGSVGPEDYDKWAMTFGNSVTPGEDADGNGDGIVDGADYTFWRDLYDLTLGSGAGSAAGGGLSVPEPASLVLLGLGAALLAVTRRRVAARKAVLI